MIALQSILTENGIEISEDSARRLETYRDLLIDWNTRMDLTAVSEEDMAARHFLDSLTPLLTGLFVEGATLIDVGTGAGFPGLPLAIARPDLKVTLLDAQEKRCKFLRFVLDSIGIDNARVVCQRAEIAAREDALREHFDIAVARAVAPANVLCEYLLPFLRVGGRALMWKGPAVRGELPAAGRAANLLGGAYKSLIDLPGDNAHVLAVFEKEKNTHPVYPRKNGIPARKPLGLA